MNADFLHQKLIAAARAESPRADVPYAFEKRIMGQVRAVVPDLCISYSIALWRATAPCLAIMMAVGAWVYFEETGVQTGSQAGLESDLEQTMLAAVENTGETW